MPFKTRYLMKFLNAFIAWIICTITISCNKKLYQNSVKSHSPDFDFICSHLLKNEYLKLNDSLQLSNRATIHFGNKCIYKEKIQDTLLLSFMTRYDLDRICFHKDKKDYFDSVIVFHKNYNPILGSSITINYDFGNSKLRKEIMAGDKFRNQTISIINDKYIFMSNSKPAFGE